MIIDACGLSCPQPVILTMNAMKTNKLPLQVMVDNNTALENIKRLAKTKGYSVQVDTMDEKFQITLDK